MQVGSSDIYISKLAENPNDTIGIAVDDGGIVTLSINGRSVRLTRVEFGEFVHSCIQIDCYLDDADSEETRQ